MERMFLSMGYRLDCFISQGKGKRIRDLGLRRRITQHMLFGNIFGILQPQSGAECAWVDLLYEYC